MFFYKIKSWSKPYQNSWQVKYLSSYFLYDIDFIKIIFNLKIIFLIYIFP